MDDFVVGAIAGTLIGLLMLRRRRASSEDVAPAAEPLKLEMAPGGDVSSEEEYEDPGKVERQQQLEQYRRLLREEFGVDHAGSLIDPMTGEEAATHG